MPYEKLIQKKPGLQFWNRLISYSCFTFSQQSPPGSISFFGHEDPEIHQDAPFLSLRMKRRQPSLAMIFNFKDDTLIHKSKLPDDPFYYVLRYKNGEERILQIFRVVNEIVEVDFYIKENEQLYLLPSKDKRSFLHLHYLFKNHFFEEHDVFLKEKALSAFTFKEEDVLEEMPQALAILRFPEELQGAELKVKRVFAAGLIRAHLTRLERYYNYLKVRHLILDNFERLARDLDEAGIPVRLKTEVVGCTYYPQGLIHYGKEWLYYTYGDVDCRLLEMAAARFNLGVEREGKE